MIRYPLAALFLVALGSLCAFAWCDEVPLDLLQGWSDFEKAAPMVRWDSLYVGNITYDYTTTWPHVKTPSSNDSIAVGWRRASSETIYPLGNNLVFRLDPSGIAGSNCQYFALKGPGASGWAAMVATVYSDKNSSTFFHAGDRIVFKVDYIRMVGFEGVNGSYSLRIRTSGGEVVQPIDTSLGAISAEVSATVAEGESFVVAEVFVMANLTNSYSETGVYIDGAHMYVTRAGQSKYETRSVPASRNRAIKTAAMFWTPDRWNEIDAAANSDYLIFSDNSLSGYVPRVKSLNPSIGVYLYQTSQITRTNDGSYDSYYSNAPVGYSYSVKSHPEWFYTDGVSATAYLNDPDYPNTFYTRRSIGSYQDAWQQGVLSRSQPAGFDGVFIDDLEELARKPEGTVVPIVEPKIDASEIQSFIHGTVTRLKSAGLSIIKNGCRQLLETGQGQVYMDPFWQPDSIHPASQGYTSNSPSNTPDATFQEWAFFSPYTLTERKNRYDNTYWLQCLQDMDAVGRWNTATGSRALSSSQKKMLFVNVRGSDRTEDPAYGVDGWLHFGLCSYLLAQNDWTVFCCGLASTNTTDDFHANIDYSITKRLGALDGTHQSYSGDIYCRYRRYKATADGGLGGVVVVNGNTDASRAYTLDFDATDESGNPVPSGTTITLKPHTGRIFLRSVTNINISLSVPKDSVAPGQTVSIAVNYVNNSDNDAKNVVIKAKVPDEMTYVVGSAETAGGFFDPTSNSVSWVEPFVSAGGSGTKTFSAKIK